MDSTPQMAPIGVSQGEVLADIRQKLLQAVIHLTQNHVALFLPDISSFPITLPQGASTQITVFVVIADPAFSVHPVVMVDVLVLLIRTHRVVDRKPFQHPHRQPPSAPVSATR